MKYKYITPKIRISESRKAEKDLLKAPIEILRAYEIWTSLIEVHGSQILRNFPGYRDEKLKGDWASFRSSRLSKQWRVIYSRNKLNELEVICVERVTAHDYRRKK